MADLPYTAASPTPTIRTQEQLDPYSQANRYRIFAITCPLKRPSVFGEMRRDRPELFARACALEALLNERRTALGKDPVWLTRFNRPLADAVGRAQDVLPGLDLGIGVAVDGDGDDDAGCDNGACFT
jgi:hypothetical protein